MKLIFTGKTLKMKDTIKEGIYKGEKVSKVIRTYGKKGIWEILKSYDLDEEILKKYHFHKKDEQKDEIQMSEKIVEQKDEVQVTPNVSQQQVYVTTKTWEDDWEQQYESYVEYQKTLDWDHIDDDYWYEKYLKDMGGGQEEEMSDDEGPYEEYVGDPNPYPQNEDVSLFGPWNSDRNCFL